MHQLILLTALSATTGLFGGGRHHGHAHSGRMMQGYSAAPASSCQQGTACGTGYAAPQYAPAQYAPAPASSCTSCGMGYAAPQYAPAPVAAAAPQMTAAPATTYYNSSYLYQAGSSCAGGSCSRR